MTDLLGISAPARRPQGDVVAACFDDLDSRFKMAFTHFICWAIAARILRLLSDPTRAYQ
jgi:hypothetical protein